MSQCVAEFPCHEDPDEPCFCRLHVAEPRYAVRYSARAVEQMRDLSGDRRWPLKATPDGGAA